MPFSLLFRPVAQRFCLCAGLFFSNFAPLTAVFDTGQRLKKATAEPILKRDNAKHSSYNKEPADHQFSGVHCYGFVGKIRS